MFSSAPHSSSVLACPIGLHAMPGTSSFSISFSGISPTLHATIFVSNISFSSISATVFACLSRAMQGASPIFLMFAFFAHRIISSIFDPRATVAFFAIRMSSRSSPSYPWWCFSSGVGVLCIFSFELYSVIMRTMARIYGS